MSAATTPEVTFDPESVFEVDDYLYFYGDWLTDDRSDAEVDGLVQMLALDEPRRILDLACGFGRHANRLAARGHSVVGIDYTPGFLDLARAAAQKMGVEVDYRQGDMRTLDLQDEFDRVLILFTAFGYFSDEENAAVLANVARALKPGGLLGFDLPNRDVTLKTLVPAFVEEKEGNLMINRSSFDPLTGRWINRRIVVRDGVRRDKPFFVRLYNYTEIRDLLAAAGLEVQSVCANWRGEPFAAESRGMAIVARKES
jgi:SAM-dependent methyltransferase